jgi:formate hydrogenlyase subunit 6/NADH:ubiquinone oxidoreductase subunit I
MSDRLAAFPGGTAGTEQETTLSIHCHQAVPQERPDLSASCLGGVSENIILCAALSGFQKVALITGDCSVCRLRKGEAQLRDLISSARLLLDSTGFREIPLDLQSKQRNRDRGLARKALFAVVSDRVKDHVASVRHRPEKPVQDTPEKACAENGIRPSPRRTFLRQLLTRVSSNELREVSRAAALRWANIAIEEGKCSACGTCVAVCPTGALEQATEDGCRILSFHSSACTKCSLCIEACPEDAIVYDERWSLADLLEDGDRVVARVDLAACVVCGEVIPAAGDEVCATCEKRGAWQCI